MKSYHFNATAHGQVHDSHSPLGKRVLQTHALIKDALNKPYQTGYSCVKLPFDNQMRMQIQALVSAKKKLNPSMLIVIGIGGSNLGTKAIDQFLFGPTANSMHTRMPCFYIDTFDPDYMANLLALIEPQLAQGHEILVNVISKSGTTLETIGNFSLIGALLKQYRPDTYHQWCVITTDRDSALWKSAQQEHYELLEIPAPIGGRFSVLSAVSLFPLGMMGVDLEALHTGAQDLLNDMIEKNDPEAQQAALLNFYHLEKDRSIQDMFLFGSEMENLGKWYRQLFAESLGKEKARGITPTVSIGSTDLHSMGQLYLGGPDDKYYTLIALKERAHDYHFRDLPPNMRWLEGKSMNNCIQAIMQGFERVLREDGRPYESFILEKKDAYSCGQFLQFYMLRVIYLAALLELNPFDQPHVERYKHEMREIL